MELKEYIKIIRENYKVFFSVIAMIVIGAFAYFFLKPDAYQTSLTINITRSGKQESSEYKFDDFYRLQADEKFAETIVEWLKSPRVVADIFKEAEVDYGQMNLRQIARSFKPEKRSSQIVSVSFSAPSFSESRKISNAIVSVVSKNTADLDRDQKESTWFKIMAQEPITAKDTANPFLIALFSLLIGLFISFWTVLVIRYLKN